MLQTLKQSVIDWLLDADPAIRWQVIRDLLDAPAHEVIAERARVASAGWGADILAQQAEDGSWGGGAFNGELDSTMHVLTLLREFGLDPTSDAARSAIQRVRDGVYWQGWDWEGEWQGFDYQGNPFFDGEMEPCINAQTATSGLYFGQHSERILAWLLKDQLEDGGWNCEAERGATVGSFNTTICVLEALLAYEQSGDKRPEIPAARKRGEEYLLERCLFRRKSTGEVIRDRSHDGGESFADFTFPTLWHYDVLRALEHFRRAGVSRDPRLADAIALVRSKGDKSGRWTLDYCLSGRMALDLGERTGEPSRWITLRALRVLRWYAGANGQL
jgi:hypothetical protein